MSINELIQSYPEISFDLIKFLVYWFIIGMVVVVIIGVYEFVTEENKVFAFSMLAFSFLIMVVLGIGVGFGIFKIYEKPYEEARASWKEEVFHKQYLASLEEMKIDIVDYSVGKDGSISVLLDTIKKEKSIGGISQISYYTSKDPTDRGYIKAKYVEAIEQIGIAAGFYDVEAFIPKPTK